MKFAKGLMIGGLITTGVLMMYTDNKNFSRKKMVKKGRQMVGRLRIL